MTESKTRVEAFSNGVFAIATTLLILEIKVPHAEHGLWAGHLAAALLAFVQPWLGLALNISLWAVWIRLAYRSRRSA